MDSKIVFLGYFCDNNQKNILSNADNFAQLGYMNCFSNYNSLFISTHNFKGKRENYKEKVNGQEVLFLGSKKHFSKVSKFINLYKTLKKMDAEIIVYYNNLFLYNVVCFLLYQFHGKKYIPILITNPYDIKGMGKLAQIKYFFQKKISSLTLKKASGMIKITDHMQYHHKNSIVIHGGIDEKILREYAKLVKRKKEEFLITYTGALYYRYNLEKIIHVVNHLEGIKFHMYGTGDQKDSLISLQNDRIKYMGNIPRESLLQVQKDADILVALLNVDELSKNTFPSKIFEYLATGNEVIVSDLKSLEEPLKELCHVVPKITEEEIEKVICSILKGNYKNDVRKAHEVLKNYTWEANSLKIKLLLQEVQNEKNF